ncbi:putative WD40/YVTN repeat-like-containing domain superfamily [Septoria linicola]|nr:putative WD40/YVTN repeat-like-containing domain superfamily [Septoria linicola]
MADMPPPSSQESHYFEQHRISIEKENFPSSPPRPQSRVSDAHSTHKAKGLPTITPRRFKKFFQPQKSVSTRGSRTSKAGRQLRDITKNGVNRRAAGGCKSDDFLPDPSFDSSRPLKRRRYSPDVQSSPLQSSPLRHGQVVEPIHIFDDELSEAETLPDLLQKISPFPKPVQRLRHPGPSRRILERSFGGHSALSQGFRGVDHGIDWRAETAGFMSSPRDSHVFGGVALPFCTTACNTNSLVAVGDEEGTVHILDSSPSSDFGQAHVKFKVHSNAVMDVAFSSDDYILATASGDQTARVVDMQSQKTICILSGHKSSVKQVRFQPNDDNMITTSSRDGSIQIWDLRCGSKSTVQNFRTSLKTRSGGSSPETRFGKALDVGCGHKSDRRPYNLDNRDELSITSFHHLPNGREHMIITSSEVDASVKLWDLRNAGLSGRKGPVPLSSTPVPIAHSSKRNFGINSMALSGDGSKLYTVCRDWTVYAHSMNQIVLGNAPEMSTGPSRRRMLKEPMSGLGPLYGFKHPQLRLSTFYIKAALRPATGDRGEMLAVGSSDNCPVLFPTDERHLPRRERPSQMEDDDEDDDDLPLPPRGSPKSAAPASGLPIYEHGTALIGGHHKEVTSMAWTTAGDLISVADDYSARCWREEPQKARELRSKGDFGGERWRMGWADVDAEWDEEEC